jgi:hypothetical protein
MEQGVPNSTKEGWHSSVRLQVSKSIQLVQTHGGLIQGQGGQGHYGGVEVTLNTEQLWYLNAVLNKG